MSNLSNIAITHTFNGDSSASQLVNASQLDTQLGNLAAQENAIKNVIDGITRSDNTLADKIVRLRNLHPEVSGQLSSLSGQVFESTAKTACRVVAITSTGRSGLLTIDGVTLVAGNRVLCTAEASSVNNGIFVVTAGGGAWTRADDLTTGQTVGDGWYVVISEGQEYGGSTWDQATTTSSAIVGTDALTFAMNGGAGLISTGSTTSRRLSSRFADVTNVKDFGAVGDGITNDATALQSAITAATTSVYVPRGTYVVNSQISLKSNIVVYGPGTIKAGASINSIFYLEDCSNVKIDGVTFDGNSNVLSCVRVYTKSTTCDSNTVVNCTFGATKTDAGLVYGCIEVASVYGSGGPRHSNFVATDNRFKTCGTHGAVIAYTDGVVFSDNVIDSAHNHGMEAVSCSDIVISGNKVSNCLISGLGVGTHCINWIITGNTIRNCAGDGAITCEHNSVNGCISNNTIIDAFGTAGINVSYGTATTAPYDKLHDIKVTGNVIQAKSGYTSVIGVNFYSNTGGALGVNNTIECNTIADCNVGVHILYCNESIVRGNTVKNIVGSSGVCIWGTLVSNCIIANNSCDTNTGDHFIKIDDYAGQYSSYVSVLGNICYTSGAAAKSLVYITGANSHIVAHNITQGSKYYAECPNNAVVYLFGNIGPLATSPYSGTGVVAVGNGNYSSDVALVGGKRITAGTAAPASGTWSQGEKCINSSAAVGQPKGWICTVGGTPGTWVSEGNL